MVSKIFYVQPYLGKIPILTNIFQMGWFNHQLLLVLLANDILQDSGQILSACVLLQADNASLEKDSSFTNHLFLGVPSYFFDLHP